ncbi:unnamed protein product, partial [Mesorhabditis belari]|uniref:Uncharacterized protein n=1 Tax=Mesorhabditis belari TaxID=2138241 RepID=A0AAF3EKJ0_9BILA
MQKLFIFTTTILTWVLAKEENLANRPLSISFWPGVSWESKNPAIRRSSSLSTSSAEKRNLEENEILNRIRGRLRNCFMQPFECQMEPLTQKGTILLQKLHEQLEIESPLQPGGELRRFDETRKKMELARTFRNYHSHFLYNPLFRLQAFTDSKHKKNARL